MKVAMQNDGDFVDVILLYYHHSCYVASLNYPLYILHYSMLQMATLFQAINTELLLMTVLDH